MIQNTIPDRKVPVSMSCPPSLSVWLEKTQGRADERKCSSKGAGTNFGGETY